LPPGVLPLAARRVFAASCRKAYQTRFDITRRSPRLAAPCRLVCCGLAVFAARVGGEKRVLPQGVAHQPRVCAQDAARLGVKNRLMPRELAASVLPALDLITNSKFWGSDIRCFCFL
jgi:hypothetical protein